MSDNDENFFEQMKHRRLLHIYDADDFSIRSTAWMRRNIWNESVYKVPIQGGAKALLSALDDLVNDGEQFHRCLFETHGNIGNIFFNGEPIKADDLRKKYTNRGYEKLFPYMNTKIYFNGCDIADNDGGWDFLDAAGEVFLKLGGGVTFAQTELGHPVFPSGHVVHFGADTCYSVFLIGGKLSGHVRT